VALCRRQRLLIRSIPVRATSFRAQAPTRIGRSTPNTLGADYAAVIIEGPKPPSAPSNSE
jgi:hypothetical protein